MDRPLVSISAALSAAVIAAILLTPAPAPAQYQTAPKEASATSCKAQESTLAMAQKATSAITLDLSSCKNLSGDDKSRCQKPIRDGYDTALETAHNTEKAAKNALACCQKPGSKACRSKPARKR
jgi:hypothetical protein